MKIELKSNRKLFVWFFLSFSILFAIGVFAILIALVIEGATFFAEAGGATFVVFIVFISLMTAFLIPALFLKFLKGKKYIFTENEIFVYNRKQTLEKIILVENVDYMRYYPQRFRHIMATLLLDFLYDGITMKIHIKEKDGKKNALGYIILKDARRLKEMYPELLSLIYYVSATVEYPCLKWYNKD